MRLAELLDALDYTAFPQYYLKTDHKHAPDLAPLFRSAKDAGVDGIYVIQSSPQNNNFLPVRPAVYVAQAQTPEDAREIHRRLWNLGQAPFLVVLLPNQIRVYTGFDYSVELIDADHPLPIEIEKDDKSPFAQLFNERYKELSQWVYIQRGLRIFVGLKAYIYKAPHLINWTRTQALNDAGELIAEVLSAGMVE